MSRTVNDVLLEKVQAQIDNLNELADHLAEKIPGYRVDHKEGLLSEAVQQVEFAANCLVKARRKLRAV